jgi:hypothetical protein
MKDGPESKSNNAVTAESSPRQQPRRRFGSTQHRPLAASTAPAEPAVPADEPEHLSSTGLDDLLSFDGEYAGSATFFRPKALIGAVAAVAALVAGAVVYVATRSDSPSAPKAKSIVSATGPTAASTPALISAPSSSSGSASATPSRPAQANTASTMTKWAEVNLSKAAVIVADPSVLAGLRTEGFTKVHADTEAAGLDWHTVDYLIGPTSGGDDSSLRAALLRSSVPVAVFGTQASAMKVAQVFASGSADVLADQRKDRTDRQLAGAQLAKNPNVIASGLSRTVLSSGELDLRTATVLALLAQQDQVRLTATAQDPAEKRAGLPIRIVTITVDQPQDAETVLGGLPVAYQPRSVTTISESSMTLRWPVAVASVLPAG